MSTRGGLADVSSRHIRKKCAVTTNCKKSAEVIVPREKNCGKDRTIVSPKYRAEGSQHDESRTLPGGRLPASRELAYRKTENRTVQTCLRGL